MSTGVLLDKSFVQGAKAAEVQALCVSNRVLMPDVLFLEMLSSEEPGRSRCFAKFPATENPVIVVPNLGQLIRYEFANHRGCGPPSGHAFETRYRFNPGLAKGDYRLPAEAHTLLNDELERIKDEVVSFIQLVNTAPLMFADAFSGSAASRKEAKRQIEDELATPEPTIRLYSQLTPPPEAPNPPPAAALDPSWATFRSLQAKLLASLDIAFRYGPIQEVADGPLHTKMEHYMFDAQYAMLGALEGALATRDIWMRDLWRKMTPEGKLL